MIQTAQQRPAAASDPFVAAFARVEQARAGQPSWLFPLRKAGLARFAELGFPTLQHEDWRFTNVAPIAQLPFRPLLASSVTQLPSNFIATLPLASLAGPRAVFVDGHFAPALSNLGNLPKGVKIASLAAALVDDAALVQKHLGQHVRDDANAFAALNAAYFQDGAFIFVPAGVVVPEPIQLIHVASSREAGATANLRHLIIAEAASQSTIIESYVAAVDAPYFTNVVTELVAADSARVEHCKFQDESTAAFHIAALHATFGRASNVWHHSFALGARIARNSIRTRLEGEGLECILNGLYLPKGNQIVDHHMLVEHAQPRCASHEYFNGILDDHAKGVFHGRILVQRGAQKTDAKQTNKNLLLSDTATVDTKPQLEIYADDVKCTHGATIGQMNDESVFYLRSRGIGTELARRMLMHGFAGEIIDRVQHMALREVMDKIIWERLEMNPQIAERK